VSDGVALYNFFRSLPTDLTIYNAGATYSAAVIAYLGAKKRKTSASAAFMLHRTAITFQSAKSAQLEALADATTIDDVRTEKIIRDNCRLTEEQWLMLDRRDLYFSGVDAVTTGISHEVAEFSPPPGAQLFFV